MHTPTSHLTLTLLRHAKSSWSDPKSSDHQRLLNHRGLRDAPFMGARIGAALPPPEAILCSDAKRTQQTAELLLPAMGWTHVNGAFVLNPRIYEASAQVLLEIISNAPKGTKHLLIIGHNPGIERLCSLLLPDAIKRMPTCAVSSFSITTDSWAELLGEPTQLLLHDFPKNID